MADSEKDLAGEDQEGSSANPEEKSEGEAVAKSLTDYSTEEILAEREDLARYIQSEKDKVRAAAESRAAESLNAALEKSRVEQENRELQRLIDEAKAEDDYGTLGKKAAGDFEQQQKDIQAAYEREQQALSDAKQFNQQLSEAIVTYPEYASLGTEVIEEARRTVEARQGTVVDFMAELGKKKAQQDLESERAAIRGEFSAELDAKLAEYGLEKRQEATDKGEIAAEEVSGEGAGKVREEMTWEQATDAFNAGQLPWVDYKPIKEAHEAERKRR